MLKSQGQGAGIILNPAEHYYPAIHQQSKFIFTNTRKQTFYVMCSNILGVMMGNVLFPSLGACSQR